MAEKTFKIFPAWKKGKEKRGGDSTSSRRKGRKKNQGLGRKKRE